MNKLEPKNLTPHARKTAAPISSLGRFVDRLLQTFEDRRAGLTDAIMAQGEGAVQAYFAEIYQGEEQRLNDTIADQPLLSVSARARLRHEVDTLVRRVVIPAYAREALKHTVKERNDFYLLPERLHALERILFGVGGMLVGLFVIFAPFIPLWSKEWILPFMVAGLLFPNIRSYFQLQRYEADLNRLVAQADREFARIDVAYLTSGESLESLPAEEPRPALAEEIEEAGRGPPADALADLQAAPGRASEDLEAVEADALASDAPRAAEADEALSSAPQGDEPRAVEADEAPSGASQDAERADEDEERRRRARRAQRQKE